MKYKVLKILCVFVISGVLGCFSVKAYDIIKSNGFSPLPAYVYCYSGFSNETMTAVHNGCVTWNNGGQGTMVYRSTSTHDTTIFPLQNTYNQITKGFRGTNNYLMGTRIVYTYNDTIYEADIDINVSHPFGTASTSYDTRTVITHELGHLLGLGEELEIRESVMYHQRRAGEKVHALSEDDRLGLIDIYQTE